MAYYGNHTDETLVLLLNTGDREAFGEIYRRYWDKLFYWGVKRLGDMGEVENLVQDIFVDLWNRRERLEVRGELNHYLAVALKYKVIRAQARAYRVERLPEASGGESRVTEEVVAFEELQERLALLVRKLPAQCKIAYTLRDAGFSQKEIAREMQISEHTVERHVSRALQFLRKGLAHLFFFLL